MFVSKEFPFLGASPDGLVHCTCHGRGLLEIKCPSNHKESLELWYTDPNCPVLSENMKTNHPYYYQVQHQMLVTNLNYCDFYVWSNGKTDNDQFLVRIEKDTAFCETMMAKHAEVFDKVILPELLTRKSDPKIESKAKLYCLCRRPSFPPMIACDNKLCKIEWFHYSCVNVKKAPRKSWYCPDCKRASLN